MAIFCNRMVNRVVDRHNDSTCEITRATWVCTRILKFALVNNSSVPIWEDLYYKNKFSKQFPKRRHIYLFFFSYKVEERK